MFTTLMMGRSVVDFGAAQAYSAAHGTGPGAAEPIAVVGMACRMPGGASNPESFWQFLRGGGDGVVEVPRSRMELPGPRRAGLLTGIDEFDAEFFGISPREAACLDPRHRLLLEVAWEALEHAGCPADRLVGRPVGVFVGVSHDEGVRIPSGAPDRVSAHALTGGAASFAAGRLSYHLGLRGPSLAVDTATSSSLVAVHLAGQSLRSGESDLALAGGAHVLLSPYWFRVLSEARMLSPTGCCRVFDAAADGYVRGEGCGVVVLERLSDATANGHRIWAVIRGSAVNSDGRSRGITAPDPDAQADLIRAALRAAGLPPERIDYVEAHGTGTPTGDPAELRGLCAALGGGRDGRPLPVGSVKTNIGHLEPAAGVAGLIKAVLCVAHGEIPPHLHLDTLNPVAGPGITVPTRPTALPQGDRPSVVGVSSFGASGTNAHVILERAGDTTALAPIVPERTAHVLALSAKSAAALAKLADRYSARLSALDENRLADLCFTANTGRAAFPHRAAFAASTVRGMRERLARLDAPNRLGGRPFPGSPTVFLFPGRDAAYPGMGRLLLDTAPRYRETLDEADEVLRPLLSCPLSDVLNRDDLLAQPRYARPALFAVEYALARLWRQWGVEPDVLLGRGIGEQVAACVRGVLDFPTGLRLAVADESGAGTDGATIGFAESVRAAVTQGAGVFLELGPTPTLLGPVGDVAPDALLLPSLRRGYNDWQVLAESVAALHTAGAAIDWRRFDEGRGRRLVTAPTYPFRRDRHGGTWPEESVPLLGRRLQSPLATAQFESTLAPAAHRVIDEQVVDGRPLAGVGVHLAMAVAAARESTGTAAVTIRDYELTRALWLAPDDRRRVQFMLEPDGSFRLYAAAAADPAAWDQLCLGHTASGADPSTVDIAEIRGRLTGDLTADALYRRLWRRTVYLGPAARWIDGVQYADGEAMARLRPPESTVWDGNTPHPGLTEAMFHTVLACLPDQPPMVTRIDRFVWHGPTTDQPLYCHCQVDRYAESPYPPATFILANASGRIIAEAHRVEFRAVSRTIPITVHDHATRTRNAVTAEPLPNTEPLPDAAATEPVPVAADTRTLPVVADAGAVPAVADTRVVPAVVAAESVPNAEALPVVADAPVVPVAADAGALPVVADTRAVPAASGTHAVDTGAVVDTPDTAVSYGDAESVRRVVFSTLARVLGVREGDLDPGVALTDLGLDSWMALEAQDALREELGVGPPLDAFLNAPSISGFIADLIGAPGVGAEAEQGVAVSSAPDEYARYEPFPLTDLQHAYLVGRSTAFELGGVSTYSYVEVDIVGLDLDRLSSALRVLVRRHDMLRAVVGADGTQRVLATVPEFIVRTVDLAELSASDRAGALDRIRGELKNQVLDAATWPLFDVRITRLDARTTRLHVGLDALVVDGWSAALLFREWATVYREGARALPELSLTFRDYLTALRERRSEHRRAEAERYWRERIAELSEAPRLPLATNPADLGVPEFTHHTTTLSITEWAELRRLAGAHGVTPSAALCAAYSWILSAWSGTSAFTLNVMFSNRVMLHEQVDAVVGNFSTTTLLAVGLADETFARLAERIQGRLWTDLEHGDMSGVEVLREINRARGNIVGASMPVVFASMVNFASRDTAGGMTGMVHHLLGLGENATEVYSCVRTPQVWLDHQVIEEAGALVVNWDVVTGLFPDGMIETMFGAYVGLLRGLAADESAWQRPAPILVPEADLEARRSANATGEPVDTGLLHEPFLERAEENPHALAVVSAEETLSYGELDGRSAKLARRLRDRGVGRGALVAVVLDKGAQQVVAVLGILRAGAGYVPVDPDVPAERLRVLLAESGVAAIVTQREVERRTPWPVGWDRLCIDETDSDRTDHEPVPECDAQPDDLAYVIFTSGSTGTPKGVMIEHRAARNTVLDINERFGIGPADRVLGLSALNFDLSVYDIFGTLAAGAALVLPEPAAHREPARWADLVAEHAITVWNSVPALMEMFVDHLAAQAHPPMPLRVVLLSGDWIPVTLPNRIRELAPDTVICGLGGATEAAIWSIHHRIDAVDPARTSIPYGKPLRNQRFHVLDEAWRPCPTWVPGELYIAGAGLARGYLGDEAKTKASFVRHPTTDERLYRTGDLGRYLPDGAIEFLGRRDTQVKINGYRVELGEIEAALLRDPRVRAAAAAVVGDGQDRRLAAYAVPAAAVTPDELATALRAQLPDYLVPRHIVLLDALPLGRNGKLDRAALPRVEFSPPAPAVLVAPRDEIERTLADIWAEFFPGRDFGMDTTFFALGGNSLLAVRLMARIGAQLGPSLPLSVLFGHPTIATLADVVREGRAGRARRAALVPISETGSATPWVLAHPVGGDVLCYSGLAALLGPGRPVYALQVPDTDEPLTTIPELAAHYIAALDTALPRGRYRLGGWSMGGMIALEMAARMSLRGTEIESVAMIDVLEPPTPRQAAVPEDATLLSWFARDLAGLAGTEWTPSPAELRSLTDLHDRARAAGVLPPDVDADTLSAIVTRFSRNTRALLTYRAPTYAGTVRFYRAAQGATPATATAWLARCTGDARIIDLPGDHYGIVRPPHVDALAAALLAPE
ncbi:non-ribosomal peptide synthetase/type I polyketide synthase [Nocardia terpenica]|uniref:Phenyloxazoline synthase MbtB n=1 Tax=Nocardia terpenica TaxID=455432 RepID=A0A6G9Z966_9NOCA|nr:non-ribosomal peptide synthetase/type I polyketide synthase [Nocardia terpenica]QIS22078.1 amino acid adenylation domain-containing protein [Nocardia terpenica]